MYFLNYEFIDITGRRCCNTTLSNNNFPEMPTTTENINQYFKLQMFIILNHRVLEKLSLKYFQFKILVDIFRSGWHLW